MGASTARSAIFVGRERELHALEAQAISALAGRGTFTLITGAAGIGKTRLLETAAAAARERGHAIFTAANYANVRAPFGPFSDILRDVRAVVPKAVPEVASDALLFSRLIGIASDSVHPSEWDKRRLFVIVAEVLARAAVHVPLFLAIDDMQWADPESIEIAGYLATRVDRSRMTIVLARRDRSADDSSEDDLIDLSRRLPQALSIDLEPLDGHAARTIVASLPDSASIDGRVVDEICRRGDGNPFLLEELTLSAKSAHGGNALPKVLQQTTLRRIASLDDRSVSILETASAIGRNFELDRLIEATDAPSGRVVTALRRARDLDIVEEHESGFRFRHELVRIAIYDSMLAAQRAAIHRGIAETLVPANVPAETLAYHWHGAGELRKAAEYAERAGDHACELNAHASARDAYWSALESGTLDDAERARIDEKIASAYDLLGDAEAAARHYVSALDFAKAMGRESAAVDLELAYATVVYRAGEVDSAIDACSRAVASPNATRLHMLSAHVSLATFYAYRGDVGSSRQHIAAADGLNPEHAPLDHVRLEWARATAAVYAGDGAWLEPASLSVELAQRFVKASTLSMTLMSYAAMTRECGRSDLASGALHRAIELADSNGLSMVSAYGRCELLDDLATRGRLEAAYAVLLEITMLGVKADVVRMLAAGLGLPVLIDLERSELFPQFQDPKLLETAFEAGEPFRLAPLAAAHAYAAWMNGRTEECHSLIARVLPKLSSPKYIGGPLLLLARGSSAEQLRTIRDIFLKADSSGLMSAYRHVVDAMLFHEEGNVSERTLSCERALLAAKKNEAPLVAAFALELSGRREDAIVAYRDCGAVAHTRRLQKKRTGILSTREAEVALLVGTGLSNRAIAERLFLSERTVENHVAAIYAKSGVRTRSEFLARAT